MSTQFRLPCPAVPSRLKRAGPIAAALMAALVLVPTSSAGNYTDPAGDGGKAGDITSVTVAGDKGSGQLLFKITGTNIASSEQAPLFLDIDSDANPMTGNAPRQRLGLRVPRRQRRLRLRSLERLRLGRHTEPERPGVRGHESDPHLREPERARQYVRCSTSRRRRSTSRPWRSTRAPNDGAFNYSLDANGPQIDSVDVQTTPTAGPKAGKRFVIVPTGLKLPPDGRTSATPILPESYSCVAKLGAKKLAGSGTGGCTVKVPKKKARGKRLTVLLTVNYQGATKVVPLTFKVG